MSAANSSTLGVTGFPATTAFTLTQTVAGGDRVRATVGTIEEGEDFLSTVVSVATVQDPGGELDVALFDGDKRITPDEQPATMSTDLLVIPAVAEYDTGSEIDVLLDARDRSSSIDVTVQVAGLMPDDVALITAASP